MNQKEFNRLLTETASTVQELPPAFDDYWWRNCNVSYREYLTQQNVTLFSKLASELGLKFSPIRYVRECLPDTNLSRRKVLISGEYEYFNGIWTPKGNDPYTSGEVLAKASGSSATLADGCFLARGLVTLK